MWTASDRAVMCWINTVLAALLVVLAVVAPGASAQPPADATRYTYDANGRLKAVVARTP
jgi:hypothetical protein